MLKGDLSNIWLLLLDNSCYILMYGVYARNN